MIGADYAAGTIVWGDARGEAAHNRFAVECEFSAGQYVRPAR